jgi:repressor LexA
MVLHFLEEYTGENHRPPTVREIQEHCGFRSPRAVSYILEKLEQAQLITRQRHSRGIQLANRLKFETGEALEIPLFEAIPAGLGDTIEGNEAPNTIKFIPTTLGISNPQKAFAIRVRGDSMIDAGIFSGDVVVLENKEAKIGDIVAALIDGESTLKRLVRQGGEYFLRAENPRFPDLFPLGEMTVQGVVVSVLRNLAAAA